MVSLWYAPSTRYPGGFRANYNSVEEALTQAQHDVEIERDPAPVRIEGLDGSVLATRDDFASKLPD